jgi:hypothetical protein
VIMTTQWLFTLSLARLPATERDSALPKHDTFV